MNHLFFVFGASLLVVALTGAAAQQYLRSRRSSDATWEDLLGRLEPIDREKIATVALDVIAENGERRQSDDAYSLEPEAIWQLLGGLEGLEAMERNCRVLVELAAYVQRWHPEAVVVAEQLRLNAREIEWHVSRLTGAAQTGNLQATFADYAQRAVAIYYMMTRHVLDLYEQVSFPELTQLRQAI
ncbi:MAG TPA: hypothetical protein VG714_05350 [Acidobacteriaceae bacterium]|nr:hypothetical protein [Acidobacteriaceae bacterium]